jgi:hypothetical protein
VPTTAAPVPGEQALAPIARKLAVLCWHLLTKRSNYLWARPALVANKKRRVAAPSLFYEAAWDLCRRGIFRPGIKGGSPYVADGASADGYCLTRLGRSWIEQGAPAVFLGDPDRLSQVKRR